jgi:SAM-dependent methyltransferase
MCGANFFYENRIPVLMSSQQKAQFSQKLGFHRETTVPQFNTKLRQKLYPKLLTFDPWKKERLLRWLGGFSKDAVLVDIGAQCRQYRGDIIAFDITAFPGIDLVGDGLRLPIRSDSVDGIINTGVLEHVEFPEQMVKEIFRILKPGHEVYIEVPFMQPYHPDPIDFHRYSLSALEKLLGDFEVINKGVGAGPCSSLNWLLRETVASLFQNPTLYTYVWILFGWLTAWLPLFDFIFTQRPHSYKAASSYYMIARKPR